MEYLKVFWVHEDPTEPVLLMSELDSNRYEIRKVEIFADGKMGFASENAATSDTVLSEKPIPNSKEIALDPQFIVQELTPMEFEEVWVAALSGARWTTP